jgi:hypothetical protein
VATTLAGITKELRSNTPLMYHIHALLNNGKAVLAASAYGSSAEKGQNSTGEKPAKERALRVGLKKFEHLQRPMHLNYLEICYPRRYPQSVIVRV